MKIKLEGIFAPNSAANQFDVRQIKKALNRLGYYQPYEKIGITGIPDTDVFAALKAFQKDQGLQPTGTARPDDESIKALNREASKTPEGEYIWRTVEDDKVRASHAEYNRTVRLWDDSPDPGEEFNCRCWAEPVPIPARKPDQKKKRRCFDKGLWEQDAVTFIKNYERLVQYPYLDTKAMITVGYGSNIDDSDTFMKLPWKLDDPKYGPKAIRKQIEHAYDTLQKYAAEKADKDGNMNVSANSQKDLTRLRLGEDECERLFSKAFAIFKNALSGKFEGFKCFPPGAKIALMDMIYNIGETRFTEGRWPNLFESAETRDWEMAAKESHRKDVDERRNQDTHDKFMQASEDEAEAENQSPEK